MLTICLKTVYTNAWKKNYQWLRNTWMTWLVSIFLSSRKYFDITKQMKEGLFKSKARKAVGQVAKESYGISAIGNLKKW